MSEIVNARGLSCPEPVIMAKKALKQNSDIIVIVDNETSRENLIRLGESEGCSVDVEDAGSGVYRVRIMKDSGAEKAAYGRGDQPVSSGACGQSVVVIAGNTMGRGSDELGGVLIKAFVHTLLSLEPLPGAIVFYNSGVLLAKRGSDVVDDLLLLHDKGVRLLVCGTCANYYTMTNELGAGVISNMFDIADALNKAGRIMYP